MIRPGLLAVLAITLVPLPSLAQFGGMGGMGGLHGAQKKRTVQVEMDGGQGVSGQLRLDSVGVESDLGRYEIKPEKVKAIRLSKPADEPGVESNPPRFQGTVVTTSDKEI